MVQAKLTEKSSDNIIFFLVLNSFTLGVQWFILRKSIIFQDSRRGQHIPGGSNFFKGVSGACFYTIYRTCDFPVDQFVASHKSSL